jgi:ABC-type sugar transport system ATPase subunit
MSMESTGGRPAVIELGGLGKVFPNGVEAVAGVDLTVADGELVAVVGPSGSGKSTVLRLIAGLEEPTRGTIRINGRDVSGLAPQERDVAVVFQEPALYPYLSVFENLAFGLRARRVRKTEITSRVAEVAASLGLSAVLDRRPATLSGGQTRRVALGRAVARRPVAFLLDEPLTGLDTPLRAALRADVLNLHRTTGAAVLYVTHDQAEALATGDRVAVMDQGRMVQVGPPREVYERPASRFVAGFIGSPPMNLIPCRVDSDGGSVHLQPEGLEGVSLTFPGEGIPGLVELGLRPEHVALSRDTGPRDTPLTWLGGTFEVARIDFLGSEEVATVVLGPHTLAARLRPPAAVRSGDSVSVGLDLRQATLFDAGTGLAIPRS